MRLGVLSDLHVEFERGRDGVLGVDDTGHPDAGPPLSPLRGRVDCVVLAGDIDLGHHTFTYAERAAEYLAVPMVLVAGNHEFYGRNRKERRLDRLIPWFRERSAASGGRVHFLERETATIAGVRFLGAVLWTDFRLYGVDRAQGAMRYAATAMADYTEINYRQQRRFSPELALREFDAAFAFLESELAKPFSGPTIVVTHHAPSTGSVQPIFQGDPLSPAFVSDLDGFVAASGAALWIHGHTHGSADYRLGSTRVACNPRGYWPDDLNPDFRPDLIVEVE